MKNFPVIQKVDPWRDSESPNFVISHRHLTKDYFLHFHDFYELEYVISGKAVHYINGEAIECAANSIVFLTPLDLHRISITEPVEFININFEPSFIESELSSLFEKGMYCHNIEDTYINLIFKEFNSNLEYNLSLVKLLLNCLICEISRDANVAIPQSSSNVSIEIARYIKANYTTNITLDLLSEKFGYTPNYLSSQFHKSIGITIKQFLNDTRLENAAKSLLTTTQPITDICFQSGYTSLAHFLRAFKAKYNESPGSYRRKRR